MSVTRDLSESILAAWRTSNQVTVFLVSRLPAAAWAAPVPGTPHKTIRMLAGHLHNSRCMWLKTLGRPHGIPVPAAVDRRKVSRRQLVAALNRSGRGIEALLRLGCHSGGEVPASPAYSWRNLPLDVGHVLAYFVAHEAHHRGQIVLAARQLGARLPAALTAGLWQWTKRAGESKGLLRGESPAPELEAVHPVLMSRDVRVSICFYERLGFAMTFQDRRRVPRYAAVARDGVELHLQWQDESQSAHAIDRPTYRFVVQDVDALYRAFRSARVLADETSGQSPWRQPGDTPWGTREFHLRDPDGNGLQFYRARRASGGSGRVRRRRPAS